MATPFRDIFGEPTPPPDEAPSRRPYRDIFSPTTPTSAPAQGTSPRPSQRPPGAFWSGGNIAKAMDVLRIGEFAVGGALSRRPNENLVQAAERGIRTRHESSPEFERILRENGAPDHWATRGGAFLLSMVVDPINIIPTGIIARGVGKGAAAVARSPIGGRLAQAAAVLAPGPASKIKASRQLSNVLRHQRVRTALGYEEAVGVGKEMIADSLRVTKNSKDNALRLRQTVGAYFDVGADTMVHDIAAAVSRNPAAAFDPAVTLAARQKGLQAQQAWLAQVPPDIQPFVNKWIKRVADDDKRLGQLMVSKQIMDPEVLAKWEGLHLRRIYEKFENPDKFLDFLHSTDPKAFTDYASQIARGRYPTSGVPMPTRVLEQRGAMTARAGAKLGEISDAAARYMLSRKSAEELIARGTAFQSVATRFGKSEAQIARAGLDIRDFLKMPGTAGWGALKNMYVPKAMHSILTESIKGDAQWSKLAKAIGWWKMGKVVLNPASHFRNVRTNVSLVHNALGYKGLNPVDWIRAGKEVLTNGPALQEAKKYSSAFTDTLVASEIRQLATTPLDSPGFWKKAWEATGGRMERLYEMEEQWGKMSVFLAARKQFMKRPGANPSAASARAARMAELALFNYRDVPDWVRGVSRSGFYPFITFPYKVVTQTVPLALKNPGRFSAQAKALSQLSDPLTESEKKALPGWMRTGGWFKLPAQFKINGHPVLWDLNYELAYGDLGEMRNPISALYGILQGNLDEEAAALLTPFGQLAAEIIFNRYALTGQPIAKGESKREVIAKQTTHVVRGLGPAWLGRLLPSTEFAAGGELTRSLEAAVPGGRTGKSLSGTPAAPLPYTLASTAFGLRTRELDAPQERMSRFFEFDKAMREKSDQLRALLRSTLNPADKKRRQKDIEQSMKELIKRFQKTGSAE